jgi:hypothetical protein
LVSVSVTVLSSSSLPFHVYLCDHYYYYTHTHTHTHTYIQLVPLQIVFKPTADGIYRSKFKFTVIDGAKQVNMILKLTGQGTLDEEHDISMDLA